MLRAEPTVSVARRERSLKVEVPKPEQDKPELGRVGIIAAAGFAIGVAWPWLAGVRLVPSPPNDETVGGHRRTVSGVRVERSLAAAVGECGSPDRGRDADPDAHHGRDGQGLPAPDQRVPRRRGEEAERL